MTTIVAYPSGTLTEYALKKKKIAGYYTETLSLVTPQ